MKKQAPLLLTALSVLWGGQLMRVLFPTIGWYLRDTVKVGVMGLIPYALGPFLLGFLVLVLLKLLPARIVLLIAGVGLLFARLVEQLSHEPAIDLWVAIFGAMFFVWLMPMLLGLGRTTFVYGVILGLAADTALKGATNTLDLSWIAGWWPTLIIVVLLLLFGLVLWQTAVTYRGNGRSWRNSIPLIGFGLWLFLQWLIFNNQGWVTTLTGLSQAQALLLILVGDLGALWEASQLMRTTYKWVTLLGVIVFVVGVAMLLNMTAWFVPILLLTMISSGTVLALLVGNDDPQHSLIPQAFFMILSLLLFVIVALFYYISLELPLPIGQAEIPIIAAVIVGLCGSLAIWFGKTVAVTIIPQSFPSALRLGLLLLIIPLLLLFADWLIPAPQAPDPNFPLRLMTYNVHSGFGTDGRQTIAEIAAVIEASGADVVGLQEISRGWMLDSSVDLAAWLSNRLDMPYMTFFSTVEDPLWGLAVLSRYPIEQVDTGLLPALGTLIRRGYIGATINVDGQEPLLFMNTHTQHRADDLEVVHMAQLDVILDYWGQRPYSVLVGDMNAQPGWPQMDMVLDAGFVDSWAEAGEGPGYTANAANPEHRIDWVFHTPDMNALEATVPESQASDHFPVLATLDR